MAFFKDTQLRNALDITVAAAGDGDAAAVPPRYSSPAGVLRCCADMNHLRSRLENQCDSMRILLNGERAHIQELTNQLTLVQNEIQQLRSVE